VKKQIVFSVNTIDGEVIALIGGVPICVNFLVYHQMSLANLYSCNGGHISNT
jgi:hypothetical protein